MKTYSNILTHVGPLAAGFAQAAAYAQAVFTGEHDIEDDEVEERAVVGRKEGFAVGEMAHSEPVVRKAFAEKAGEFGVVVDDTDMRRSGHGKIICTGAVQCQSFFVAILSQYASGESKSCQLSAIVSGCGLCPQLKRNHLLFPQGTSVFHRRENPKAGLDI